MIPEIAGCGAIVMPLQPRAFRTQTEVPGEEVVRRDASAPRMIPDWTSVVRPVADLAGTEHVDLPLLVREAGWRLDLLGFLRGWPRVRFRTGEAGSRDCDEHCEPEYEFLHFGLFFYFGRLFSRPWVQT
jgi:hypothetical protein